MTNSSGKPKPSPIIISLQTQHTEELNGSILLPDRAEAMVILAQVNSSRPQKLINLWIAAALQHRGMATLILDLLPLNGRDLNGRRFQKLDLLAQRLQLATAWLLDQPRTKFLTMGYFGTSIGAAAALIAAATMGRKVAAVVSAGGRPDLAHGVLSKVSAAALLIVGERDHLGIELNNKAFAEITTEKQLIVIPKATHLFVEPGALIKLGELASAWFNRYLKTSSGIVLENPAK